MSPNSTWPIGSGDGVRADGINSQNDGQKGPGEIISDAAISGSSKEVQLQDEGHYQKEDVGFFYHLSPVTLGIVSACSVAAVLLCVVALLWLRSRRRRQKLLHDLTFDGTDESRSTKSAPASRTTSPKNNKRMSCPDALSVTTTRGILVRSLTNGRVPDITLPPERVQPWTPCERRGSVNIPALPRNGSMAYIPPPDLYCEKEVLEDDEPNLPETPYGRLWFSLIFDASTEQLNVKLIKVSSLPGRSSSQSLRDPFVKMFLLPDERTCRMSKVKKQTLSPRYNEIHSFQVTDEDIRKRILRFSVYDVDKRRVRHSLGHVMIQLKSIDLTKGEVLWCDLEPMVQTTTTLGEIQFSLIYVPSCQKIKLVLHRAKNLNYSEDYPDMDVYIRAQLYYGHRCHRVKRTIAHQGGTSMTFKESLSFSVNVKQMDCCSLTISLMLTSALVYSSAEVEHGRVVIGPFMYARGDELLHWQEMLAQPKMGTTRWHSLTNISSSP